MVYRPKKNYVRTSPLANLAVFHGAGLVGISMNSHPGSAHEDRCSGPGAVWEISAGLSRLTRREVTLVPLSTERVPVWRQLGCVLTLKGSVL